jgi:hypothetical protein
LFFSHFLNSFGNYDKGLNSYNLAASPTSPQDFVLPLSACGEGKKGRGGFGKEPIFYCIFQSKAYLQKQNRWFLKPSQPPRKKIPPYRKKMLKKVSPGLLMDFFNALIRG